MLGPIETLRTPTVLRIDNEKVSALVHGDCSREPQLSICGEAAIAAETRCSISRHGGNNPSGDLAHAIVIRIGDIEIAGQIHRHALRSVQLGVRGRAVVAAKTRYSGSRHCGDNPSQTLRTRLLPVSAK